MNYRLFEGFVEKIKVLKDFYRNKGFKGSPREPASINCTVNGHIVLVTNKSNAKRADTSFLTAILVR